MVWGWEAAMVRRWHHGVGLPGWGVEAPTPLLPQPLGTDLWGPAATSDEGSTGTGCDQSLGQMVLSECVRKSLRGFSGLKGHRLGAAPRRCFPATCLQGPVPREPKVGPRPLCEKVNGSSPCPQGSGVLEPGREEISPGLWQRGPRGPAPQSRVPTWGCTHLGTG